MNPSEDQVQIIDDHQNLARFATSKGHFDRSSESWKAKASLFHLRNGHMGASVYLPIDLDLGTLQELSLGIGAMRVYGAAILQAGNIRQCMSPPLDVRLDEPPESHALITGWECTGSDPIVLTANDSESAMFLAESSVVIKFDRTVQSQ